VKKIKYLFVLHFVGLQKCSNLTRIIELAKIFAKIQKYLSNSIIFDNYECSLLMTRKWVVFSFLKVVKLFPLQEVVRLYIPLFRNEKTTHLLHERSCTFVRTCTKKRGNILCSKTRNMSTSVYFLQSYFSFHNKTSPISISHSHI